MPAQIPPTPLSDAAALSERVYRAVLQLLAQGSLAANETLRIDELAKALAVSPTPVREALARLEATGLVERIPRRGYRVPAPLSPEQLRDLMEVRKLIEVSAVVRAFTKGGREFNAALSAALERQRAAVETYQLTTALGTGTSPGPFWTVVEADLQFHATIIAHSGNSFLSLLADALQGQQHRVRQSAELGLSDAVEALQEHTIIARAVDDQDVEAVAAAMTQHLENVAARAGAAPAT